MADPIRVLVADDHPVVRDGIRAILQRAPDIELVGEAGDGAEAVRLAGQLEPDVILMDLQMPRLDGPAAIARLRDEQPGVTVLVLTTYQTDSDITRAIEAGAAGYLLKDTGRADMFEAIRAVHRGETPLSPAVATRLLRQVRAPRSDGLTSREIDVLTAVARGLANKEIANRLHISQATVKTHLLHIFDKLGVADRTAAVTYALRQGIIRLEE